MSCPEEDAAVEVASCDDAPEERLLVEMPLEHPPAQKSAARRNADAMRRPNRFIYLLLSSYDNAICLGDFFTFGNTFNVDARAFALFQFYGESVCFFV